jgi:hypothetical protein
MPRASSPATPNAAIRGTNGRGGREHVQRKGPTPDLHEADAVAPGSPRRSASHRIVGPIIGGGTFAQPASA